MANDPPADDGAKGARIGRMKSIRERRGYIKSPRATDKNKLENLWKM